MEKEKIFPMRFLQVFPDSNAGSLRVLFIFVISLAQPGSASLGKKKRFYLKPPMETAKNSLMKV